MRVLYITGEFPPMQGGVGDCTNEIALALAKRGVKVSVLTTAGAPQSSPVASPAPAPSPLDIRRVIKTWDWSALAKIRDTIAFTRAEIVHIQYQTGAFGMHSMINFAPRLLRSFLSRGGVRTVVTFHDLRPMYLFPKAGRLRDWVTFQLARTTDAVIATNEQDYAALDALRLRSLSLIPIGSNIAPVPLPDLDRDALRAKLGITPDEILLCYFGFLNASKGGETLIRALAQTPNAKLLMLGGQTGASDATNLAFLGKVKALSQNLGLTSRVLWTDFMPASDITAHFRASDICVLPYRDGASYRRGTFMAALAHGMAIVTTSDGRQTAQQSSGQGQTSSPSKPGESGLPCLRDGENVILVPPDHPSAIADAVQRIAASPDLRAKLRQGALDTAQYFTWDKIADAHLALYQNLLARAHQA